MRSDSFLSQPVVVDAYKGTDHAHVVRSIRQAQIIGLVTGIVASILLLTTLLLLIIPSIPVAFPIITGSALLVFTAVSLVSFASYFIKVRNVLADLGEASADLRECFVNCALDLAQSLSYQEFIPKQVQKVCQSSPGEEISSPESPSSSLNEHLDTSEQSLPAPVTTEDIVSEVSSGMESAGAVVENLFVTNLHQQLLNLFQKDQLLPSLEKLPRYKKEQGKVNKQFSSLCIGLTQFITKLHKGESPVSPVEAVSMFLPPLMGCGSHSVLRITCNARDLFSSSSLGGIWFQNLLTKSSEGRSLLDFLQTIKSLLSPHNLQVYLSLLRLLNFLLSGWCLSDCSMYPYIVGSIQQLPISAEQRKRVIELLASGNIIGALCFLHGNTCDRWQDVLVLSIKESSQTKIPIEHIDLAYMRSNSGLQLEESASSEEKEELLCELQRLLQELAVLCPDSLLKLVSNINMKNSPLKKNLSKIIKCFNKLFYGKSSNLFNNALSVISIMRNLETLQSRVQSYLPYAGKESIDIVISTLILGRFTGGVFSRNQMSLLAQIVNKTPKELEEMILKRKIAKLLFPSLLS
ncbi:CT214 family putative inclusion membrane protein [Chlamydia gallinacea]|uniref:Uncharacterized protein n=2 Tax=Chlamydia gallinacea TaxID=1457153 RepID=A0A173E011_9CHLA|nr:hypothetical protein [Chlamydia gallinacea]ANG66522.1 hypothetical protein M787_004260 [Chlamydia gallinacea 08-1274/3]EYE60326.1 hypothetical protein M127_5149 [Bacteroides fragilis str. S6L5]MBX6680235.1 hypothetical protein [Chlamydia gallinacea]MBX6687846.1 hypothetical protein [Chlamydia gallinacea]